MVDPIGMKAGTVADRRTASVASVEPVAPTTTVKPVEAPTPEAVSATVLSRSMASSAPVDSERVARIRRAVQEGRFPLIPSTIADRLLALKFDWSRPSE